MNDEVLVWLSLHHRINHKYQLSQMDPRDVLLRLELHCFDSLWICCTIYLQCFDTVGWAPEKHPARKTLLMRCWCCYLFLQGTLLFLDPTQRHEDNATRDICSNRPHLRTPGRAIRLSNSNNKSGSGKWVFASESGSSTGLEKGEGGGFVSECGRKTDDCECKIGQIKTTSSLENVKINLDLFVLKQVKVAHTRLPSVGFRS